MRKGKWTAKVVVKIKKFKLSRDITILFLPVLQYFYAENSATSFAVSNLTFLGDHVRDYRGNSKMVIRVLILSAITVY